jgi:hypothetical protein
MSFRHRTGAGRLILPPRGEPEAGVGSRAPCGGGQLPVARSAHTFYTKLAEAGIPEQVMLDLLGHVSQAMMKRWSDVRLEARRRAIEALERAGAEISVGYPKKSPK